MNTERPTHPRAIFVRAQGDPDNAGPLAEWAERVLADPATAPHGVVVAEDGRVLAETVYVRGRVGATYVTDKDSKLYDLFGTEIGLALGQISRQYGQRVIHARLSEFRRGTIRLVPGTE